MIARNTSLTIEGEPLIEEMLRLQREPTAVESFSRRHDAVALVGSRYYSDLIPLAAPGAGEQYAFEVDLDACSGCKACVTACHNLNGLDPTETWRDVGVLVGGGIELPVIQHVTAACHHCLDPACLDGCPVDAYEKDPLTGIVHHLDDQCIGCQYCTLKCPYDAPKYNAKRGIVRKCDMCSDRLAKDEAPACVQACPASAIRIRVVDAQRLAEDCEGNVFLPGAPNPSYTLPTTTYKTERSQPRNLLPGDYYNTAPQHPHPPLVVMLVLTQLSVGAFAVERVLEPIARSAIPGARPLHAVVALAVALVALGASVLHLGRPLYAFRAVIGLKHSWLSREIVAFGMFAKLAMAYAAVLWFASGPTGAAWGRGLGWAVAASGAIGVFCSAMVYHDTRREFWRLRLTAPKFLLTAAILGMSTVLAINGPGVSTVLIVKALVATGLAKFAVEFAVLRRRYDRRHTAARRTATIMLTSLRETLKWRLAVGILGLFILPVVLACGDLTPVMFYAIALGSLVLATAGELMERYVFFAAVIAPKMPGGLAS